MENCDASKELLRVQPLKPEDIAEVKLSKFPNEMIKAINEMIALNWDGSSSTFRQEDLVERYLQLIGEGNLEQNRKKVYENHWLRFEDIYRKLGWHVEKDRPGYNESYPTTYTFTIKK